MKRRILFLILLLILSFPAAISALSVNTTALRTVNQVFQSEETIEIELPAASAPCAEFWLTGLKYHHLERNEERDTAWLQAAGCQADYVVFMHLLVPEDLQLVERLVREVPDTAESWFWLSEFQPENAISYLQRGLALSPNDGWRWLALGRLLENEQRDPQLIIQAYLESCLNGEPGRHGCVRAANVAERIGDIEGAIRYLRLSRYPEYHATADQLEAELTSENQK